MVHCLAVVLIVVNDVMSYRLGSSEVCGGTAGMATAEGGPERQFLTYDGPQKGVTYPIKVIYCGGDHHFFHSCS